MKRLTNGSAKDFMKEGKARFRWIGCPVVVTALFAHLAWSTAGAATYDVDVFGEYTCTESSVVVDVLVNINTSSILSSGVKLTYDPEELALADATKNEGVWYLGNDSTKYAYVDPASSAAGEVVLLGAKLDTDAPTEGVSGNRVLLGRFEFTRLLPTSPTLSLSFGKAGSYANFVTTDGTLLDDEALGVAFGPVIALLAGDANSDGAVDGADYTIWADNFGQSTTGGASDGYFNGDGTVDGADYTIWADNFGSSPCE